VVAQRLHGGKTTVIFQQELRLALGVKKVNHGSQYRAVSPHVEMDLVQVKSFLVQMTLELFLHRRGKMLYSLYSIC
jgi:hypothetical protein